MATERICVEIDRQADAGYIHLSVATVERTKAVTEAVNVDLNEQDRVVGIEVLSLEAEIPFE